MRSREKWARYGILTAFLIVVALAVGGVTAGLVMLLDWWLR
jgi:hypothetical protein